MQRNLIIIAVSAAALITLAGFFIWLNPFKIGNDGATQILSFEDCVRAGYAISESSPRQCLTPDGKTFVEQTANQSGIEGMVLLGPTCPVERNPPDPQCADKPYAATLVLTSSSDQANVIKEFRSDEAGKFKIQVPPGEYAIRSAASSNLYPRCSSSEIIKVNASEYTEIKVDCDTGIR